MNRTNDYEEYYYDDPDNEYTYQDSFVLRNKFNIRNSVELTEKDYQIVKTKALDLFFSPIFVYSMSDVCQIHYSLFSDL